MRPSFQQQLVRPVPVPVFRMALASVPFLDTLSMPKVTVSPRALQIRGDQQECVRAARIVRLIFFFSKFREGSFFLN